MSSSYYITWMARKVKRWSHLSGSVYHSGGLYSRWGGGGGGGCVWARGGAGGTGGECEQNIPPFRTNFICPIFQGHKKLSQIPRVPGLNGSPLVNLENSGDGNLPSPTSRLLDQISYVLRYQLFIGFKHDRFSCPGYPACRRYPDV